MSNSDDNFRFIFNLICYYFRVRWADSLSLPISNNEKVHVTPFAGGPTLGIMLNILRGYNFTPKSIGSDEETVKTYHRVIEAFKFGMSHR